MLTKDQILAAGDIETRDVEVAEWGGTVRIRSLTGREREQLESKARELKGGREDFNIRARLLSMTMVDDSGEPLFAPSDIRALSDKSAAVLDRLFDIAMELSAIAGPSLQQEITENF